MNSDLIFVLKVAAGVIAAGAIMKYGRSKVGALAYASDGFDT